MSRFAVSVSVESDDHVTGALRKMFAPVTPSDWPVVMFGLTNANEPVLLLAPETSALRVMLLPALNVRRSAPETTGALTLMSPVAFSTRLVFFNAATDNGELIDSVDTGARESTWPRPLK